ncbi:uncharacterized protein LOC130736503 [Lotus japonicus]|uniref:uncharacterized protein LOC130736503 n=1 Tax=Lotus japonicus TaxID=34305 RepID=UPI002584D169|nr:uncharacterized protein LOC130736503 [Lotus japonicus]
MENVTIPLLLVIAYQASQRNILYSFPFPTTHSKYLFFLLFSPHIQISDHTLSTWAPPTPNQIFSLSLTFTLSLTLSLFHSRHLSLTFSFFTSSSSLQQTPSPYFFFPPWPSSRHPWPTTATTALSSREPEHHHLLPHEPAPSSHHLPLFLTSGSDTSTPPTSSTTASTTTTRIDQKRRQTEEFETLTSATFKLRSPANPLAFGETNTTTELPSSSASKPLKKFLILTISAGNRRQPPSTTVFSGQPSPEKELNSEIRSSPPPLAELIINFGFVLLPSALMIMLGEGSHDQPRRTLPLPSTLIGYEERKHLASKLHNGIKRVYMGKANM